MKKWILCLAISSLVSCLGLMYFVYFIAQDRCLDSGGRWLGAFAGCDGGNNYSVQYLASPLTIIIFLAIILGISSALVQIHSLLLKAFANK